ncbi:MAG: IclR family transcriptional regulator [Terriglobales bacterium]
MSTPAESVFGSKISISSGFPTMMNDFSQEDGCDRVSAYPPVWTPPLSEQMFVGNLKTRSVPSLERALTLLEILSKSSKGMRLGDLARHLGLAKSSTHCLLLTLERCGYLERNEQTHRYMFGLKFFSLANLAISKIRVRDVATPFLQHLAESSHMTVHLAILEQGEVVIIEKIENAGILKVATWIGKRMDMHCTGVGKATIAHLSEEELDRLIRKRGLPRHNENTVISGRKLKLQLAEIRKLGYSVDYEEDEVGLCCIGSPVFDHTGRAIGAISLAGTTAHITAENLTALAEKVKKSALGISRAMGYSGAKVPSGSQLRPVSVSTNGPGIGAD